MTIDRRQDEFITKHKEVLILRKRAQELRCDLDLIEIKLRDAERESAVLFHNLFAAVRA